MMDRLGRIEAYVECIEMLDAPAATPAPARVRGGL